MTIDTAALEVLPTDTEPNVSVLGVISRLPVAAPTIPAPPQPERASGIQHKVRSQKAPSAGGFVLRTPERPFG